MPAVSRDEVFDVTVPSGTSKTAPVSIPTTFNPGTVVSLEVIIPDGVSGLAGIRIASSKSQIFPHNTGAWLRGNKEKIERDVTGWPNSGALEVEGYNEDIYQHTFTIRYAVVENPIPKASTPTESGPISITPGGEVSTTPPGEPPTESLPPTGETGGEPPPPPPPPTPTPGDGGEPPASEGSSEAPPPEQPSTEPEKEAAPGEPAPPFAPEAAQEATGEAVPAFGGAAEGEAAPEDEAATGAPGKRTKAAKGAYHAKTRFKTEKRRHQVPPHTGLKEASTRLAGHPEVHAGVATLVNLIRAEFPALQITSTTGGTHAAGSYHYKGEAVDLASGDTALMQRAADWIQKHLERYLTEGIHETGLSVKYGKAVASSYWGTAVWAEHANHIHVAVAGSQESALLRDNKSTVRVTTVKVPVHEKRHAARPSHKGTHHANVKQTGGTAAPQPKRRPAQTHGGEARGQRRTPTAHKAVAHTARSPHTVPKAAAPKTHPAEHHAAPPPPPPKRTPPPPPPPPPKRAPAPEHHEAKKRRR